MVATILVLLALVAGTVGLASLSTSGLLGSRGSGNSDDAQAVAEAAMANIVATLNQPENRKILVSGTAMNSWASATGDTLQSPCIKNDGTRPGSNNGQPTTAAKNLGDGQFRDLITNAVNTGDRQFRLSSVTYAVGAAGNADRRTRRATTTAGSGTVTNVGTGNFHELNNLDDPVASGAPAGSLPGYNSGFITLAVEGRVFRNGVQVGTATVTREFEVMPKCCGASFGSNGSGGTNVGAGSKGSDSRFCGVQFGIITGINGGTHFSYYANDRFTTRTPDGTIVKLSTLLGALKAGETKFDRSNCRVIPTPNNGACNPSQSSQDKSWGTNFTGATPTANCIQPTGSTAFFPGTQNDILGKSASCVPIVPISLSSLPRITDSSPGSGDGRYQFDWPTNSGPAYRISTNSYPSISSTSSTFVYRMRTNAGVAGSRANPPRVEACQVTTTTTCASWTNVSDFRIADNFSTKDYAGGTSDLPSAAFTWAGNGWNGNWLETDPVNSLPGSGVVQIIAVGSASAVRIQPTSGTQTASIRRGVDIQGFSGTRVRINMTSTNLDSTDVPAFSYSTDGGINWSPPLTPSVAYPLNSSSAVVTNNYIFTLPAAANVPPTGGATTALIRMQLTANATNEYIRINTVDVAPSGGLDSWCAYTATSPVSVAPGFHCLGPSVDLSNGAQWLIDTTGADYPNNSLSFYYTEPGDSRGLVSTSPLIEMANGSSLAHVRCTTLQDNCNTPVGDNVYSPAGEPDRLNFFGRDRGASIVTQYLVVNSQFTSPVKISGVWFYFPEGDLTMNVNDCSATQPSTFYTDNNNWTLSGRVWVKNFRPCGAFHFRVPPSSLGNVGALFGSISFSGDTTFVDWSGVDWVARAVTGSSNY